MNKIVLFDVDGTLIDCAHGRDYISDYTKNILCRLKKEGYILFIASGRPMSYLMKDLKDSLFDGYILNDGAYVEYLGGELSYHPMDEEVIVDILDQVYANNLTSIAYTCHHSIMNKKNDELISYIKSFKFQEETLRYNSNLYIIKNDILKIHVLCDTDEQFNNFKLDYNKVYNATYGTTLNEIYSKEYTKATALLEVLELLNIDKKDSYFFGDGLNDIEMMDTIGHPIAMANASSEVKQHSEYICGNVNEEGVAHFIEAFFLNKK